MKTKVAIPSTITSIRTVPSPVEINGRLVDHFQHVLALKLPNGHTIEATISQMDFHKVQEVQDEYPAPVPEEPTHKCDNCHQSWQGDPSDSCPACGVSLPVTG